MSSYSLLPDTYDVKKIAEFVINESQYREFNKMNLQKTALSDPGAFIQAYQTFVIKLGDLIDKGFIDHVSAYADIVGSGINKKEMIGTIVKDMIPIIFDFVAAYDVIEEAKNKMKIVNTK